MKCHRVNNIRPLLITLLLCMMTFSADAAPDEIIEHTEHVHYNMKTGEENIYAIQLSESHQHIDALIAKVSPTLKSWSDFHFSPCLKKNGHGSVKGTWRLDSSNVVKTDSHLNQIEYFLKLQNLGVQMTELAPGQNLLFMKQNGLLITINTTDPLDMLATCKPKV